MPTVVRDGRTIHHTLVGEGPGVVLVPGLGSGSKLFGTLPRRFAKLGFSCAAVDPAGVAPSSPLPDGRYSFDDAALDVLAVARSLPRPCTLVGTSLGGKVALRAARMDREAVDALVMLCSSAISTARSRRVYRMFELLCTEAPASCFGEIVAPFLFGATFLASRGNVVDDILRGMKPDEDSRAFMRAQALALQAFDGEDHARNCAVRSLCLAGAEDTLTDPADVEATSRLLPDARFRCIAGAGHSLLLESATAFDEVVAFLRQP
jgi:3-oxoadipate enol-lactonase